MNGIDNLALYKTVDELQESKNSIERRTGIDFSKNVQQFDLLLDIIGEETPETEEKYMFFDNIEYKAIGYKEFKSLTYVYTIIDDTYTGVMNTYFLKDVDKYNKYMAISDIIYVNINSKCDVGKFDNNISTYYDKNNNKIIKSNKREAKVVKVNGKYKLEGSLYNCID